MRHFRTLSMVMTAAVFAGGFASTAGASGRDDSRSRDDSSRSVGGSGGRSAAATKASNLRLIARMGDDDTGAAARVRYEERARGSRVDRRFDVEVERAAPGTKFQVSVGGKVVATITANSLGIAKLEMRPRPETDEVPVPAGFPRLKAGDKVEVGAMSGALRVNR